MGKVSGKYKENSLGWWFLRISDRALRKAVFDQFDKYHEDIDLNDYSSDDMAGAIHWLHWDRTDFWPETYEGFKRESHSNPRFKILNQPDYYTPITPTYRSFSSVHKPPYEKNSTMWWISRLRDEKDIKEATVYFDKSSSWDNYEISIEDAIENIDWSSTPSGHYYWSNLKRSYYDGEIKPRERPFYETTSGSGNAIEFKVTAEVLVGKRIKGKIINGGTKPADTREGRKSGNKITGH